MRFVIPAFFACCALAFTACHDAPPPEVIEDVFVTIGEPDLEQENFSSDSLTLRVLGRGEDMNEFVARDKALADAKARLLRDLQTNLSLSGSGNVQVNTISARIENVPCAGTIVRRNQTTKLYSVTVGIEFPKENLPGPTVILGGGNSGQTAPEGIIDIPKTSGKVIINPLNYMNSGEKMAVIVYLASGNAGIIGIESKALGKGGYSGCRMTYHSLGSAECHAHFRDNVHITTATGSGTVSDCDADGKFQRWERGEYKPDEHFEKVIRLTPNSDAITAFTAQKLPDGSWRYQKLSDRALLKNALERLKNDGETKKFFVSRYGNVSREN